ncbi:MAG TPA: iron-sulfur cluster repair di-iron protein [Phycisphaerales bacterium]|nr:iron-sulfur cluster repair di-iron protein [Phycisphaerales bacterium]
MNARTDCTLTLGQLAATRAGAIPVFERYGLDYCCGGGRTLREACAAAELSPDAVVQAIHDEEQEHRGIPRERPWTDATMTELADHIERTHHAFVRDALARLANIMPRVVAAHGKSNPALAELAAVYGQFAEEMRDHMVREERVLFPWLRRLERPTEVQSGPPWSVRRPISCMVHDHDDAGAALARMRELTGNYTPPEGACATYRSMLSTLEALERDTHEHIHKENNILFPAGVRAEDEVAARAAARAGGKGAST